MAQPTMERALRFAEDHRGPVQMSSDSLAWLVALGSATWMRYEFDAGRVDGGGILALAAVAILLQLVLGWWSGLYRGRHRYGSFEEVAGVVQVVVVTTVAIGMVNLAFDPRLVPTSAVVVGGALALLFMIALRYSFRLLLERRDRPDPEARTPVVVVGSGEAADQLVRSMLASPVSPYLPVALLDDDPRKQALRLRGVPVMGTLGDLESVARRYEADEVVLAIPSAEAELVRELAAGCRRLDLTLRVLPPVNELLHARAGVGDVRNVTEADMLGRRVIDSGVGEVVGYLRDRRVLVTGAGGSIGSELARQIADCEPAELVLLDRDESGLHQVQLSIEGRALLDTDRLVVADLRDHERVDEVFARHRPQVVFHAAALKHLPLLELHPLEGYKTNVGGTLHVLEAAARHGVERLVNISTDKAADPTSVLGHTKRAAERLTAWFSENRPGEYVSVRFGNVLGSRGSVLTVFHAQIDNGGPVTVTHPEVTRYFMLVEEAVQLVLQAGALHAPDGAALVLDMGEPVHIADLAEQLVAEDGGSVEIVYTGLRTGEKLHEVLVGATEDPTPSGHPLITAVAVEPLSPEEIRRVSPTQPFTWLRSVGGS